MKEYPLIRLTYSDKNGQKRYRYATFARIGKIYRTLASSQNKSFVILVQYGIHEDCFGKKVMFDNESLPCNRKEARAILRNFLEIRKELDPDHIGRP